LLLASSAASASAESRFQTIEVSMQAYFANQSDERAYSTAKQSLKGIIGSSGGNAACAVYAFGILQILEGMPSFVANYSKSIQLLKSAKEEAMTTIGNTSQAKWDETISASQVELQKGLAYRGELIGQYMNSVKSYCR
jgi:hypothetical protein